MNVFRSVAEYRAWRTSLPESANVGFVPTMGALHEGHRRLLVESKRVCTHTVLSIFVNPTQFNQKEDFEKYPVTTESDLALAEAVGVDAVFLPRDPKELYPDDYRFVIQESKESTVLCGAHRPGHFNGVLSVVMKLFQIVAPKIAFFGEKDFQQLKLVRDMAAAYFLPLEVKGVPTVREASGLALSSRNRRLTSEGLKIAPMIHEVLSSALPLAEAKAKLVAAGFDVEYLEERWDRRFIAAWLDGVRLIDNVPLEDNR